MFRRPSRPVQLSIGLLSFFAAFDLFTRELGHVLGEDGFGFFLDLFHIAAVLEDGFRHSRGKVRRSDPGGPVDKLSDQAAVPALRLGEGAGVVVDLFERGFGTGAVQVFVSCAPPFPSSSSFQSF